MSVRSGSSSGVGAKFRPLVKSSVSAFVRSRSLRFRIWSLGGLCLGTVSHLFIRLVWEGCVGSRPLGGLSQGKSPIALSSSGRLSLRPLCGKFFVGCVGHPVHEESVFRV